MYAASSVIFISFIINCVRSHPGLWSAPNLNPVHGLYIKPSGDGATGDLFVAATENNGVKSQWVVDQPVNFLQLPAATQPHVATLPLPCSGVPAQPEDSLSQKRAVIPSPAPSPAVQYAYALPVSTGESNTLATYPYAYPVPLTTSETTTTKCEPSSTVPHYPYQFPFQLFYPQMMSAYANAMSILKDAGLSDDTASSAIAQATPTWPPSTYAYPMYVMVDPSTWAQNAGSTTSTTTSSSPTKKEEESTEP